MNDLIFAMLVVALISLSAFGLGYLNTSIKAHYDAKPIHTLSDEI